MKTTIISTLFTLSFAASAMPAPAPKVVYGKGKAVNVTNTSATQAAKLKAFEDAEQKCGRGPVELAANLGWKTENLGGYYYGCYNSGYGKYRYGYYDYCDPDYTTPQTQVTGVFLCLANL